MGREMRGGPKGDICKPMSGFMLKLDKKQQNSVKQLSFNKKIKEKRDINFGDTMKAYSILN